MTYQGSTVGAGAIFSSMPAGEGLYVGTAGNKPTCIGTFQHCIMSLDPNNGNVFINVASGTQTAPGLKVTFPNGNSSPFFATEINANGPVGFKNGLVINAGTNSSDASLQVNTAAAAGGPTLQVSGDGSGRISQTTGLGRSLAWDTAGAWTLRGPNTTTNPALTINTGLGTGNGILLEVNSLGTSNTVNTFLARFRTATSGAGFQSGVYIGGGTNTGDSALQIQDATETKTYFNIAGDGSGFAGPNVTNNMSGMVTGLLRLMLRPPE